MLLHCLFRQLSLLLGGHFLNPDETDGDKGQDEGYQREPEGVLYGQSETLLMHLQERFVRSGFELQSEMGPEY